MLLIAVQSLQSQEPEGDPDQERDDHPQRHERPAAAAVLGLVDLGDGLWRQYEAVAGDLVELVENARAAGEEPRHIADKTPDLGDAGGGIFELAGGPEIARHPF